jgi:hypothetical protein
MSSIILNGDTFHGISVESRGVFKDEYGYTYAGQCKDGYAYGLGVLTWSNVYKEYAEHGPGGGSNVLFSNTARFDSSLMDWIHSSLSAMNIEEYDGRRTWSNVYEHSPDGEYDGRRLGRSAYGDTHYDLYERGEWKENARVSASGRCTYNGVDCAPDDLRLLALIAQVAPVEVRPAAPAPTRHRCPLAPKQSSDGSAGSFCPPQALAAAVAAEVHPHAARRPWWPCDTTLDQPHCNARPAALQRTTTQ